MHDFPYLTFIEIIRACSKVFGVKAANKVLDDKAYDKKVDYRLIGELQNDVFAKISKYISSALSDSLKRSMTSFFDEYTQLVANQDADGVSRNEMTAMLSQTLFQKHIVNFVINELPNISGQTPSPLILFSCTQGCTSHILNWLEENEIGWSNFVNGLDKEDKAKVKAWKTGEHFPTIDSITLLQGRSRGPRPEVIDWRKVRVLTWLASVIDRTVKEQGSSLLIEECRVALLGAETKTGFSNLIQVVQNQYKNRLLPILPLVGELQNGLKRTVHKEAGLEKYFFEKLASLRCSFSGTEYREHFEYWVNWHEARLFVFTGDLDNAHRLYKETFEQCLFRSGINQRKIIEEALVVVASLKSPDRVFLKQLKNALITFKYDIPSVIKLVPSNKFADIVEDWEVENWKASFNLVFPKEGMFQGGKEIEVKANIGPIIVTEPEKIKPDYKNSNRKIKVGDNWQKAWPQLVWFTDRENLPVVKMLLENGADVNLITDAGDTAILMALEALNVKAMPYRSLNKTLFNLISDYPHKQETINTRTAKKRLLPIISAVESGKLDVVRKVLAMGADVNMRGGTDNQAALNVCLKLLGMVKDPELYWRKQIDMELTSEVLDSIRRHNPGMTGFTLSHQKAHIASQKVKVRNQRVLDLLVGEMVKRVEKHMSLDCLRQIASLLIESGADVDAEHSSPVMGYTPLMLAAELDEVQLFNKMLMKEGNPRKSYFCKRTEQNFDCWDIADFFKSTNVALALKDVIYAFPIENDQTVIH